MKDFSSMAEIDVVRETGVCQSIAGMLTNIYKNRGFDSCSLVVNASSDSIINLQ